MIKALLWKDFRLQRDALITTLLVIATPYVYATYEYLRNGSAISPSSSGLWTRLNEAGQFSLMASVLVVAMLAGAAFARERSDRSHEFLAVLPTTRIAVLGSKAFVVLIASGLLWLSNPYVITRIACFFNVEPALLPIRPSTSADAILKTVSVISLSVFGTGWLGSMLVANAASSLLIGLLSPFLSLVFAYGIADSENAFQFAFVYACLFLGTSCLAVGTIYFLYREEV